MKFNIVTHFITATAAAGFIGLSGQAAQAGQFHNGWNYAIDSFSDGSGGSSFEIKGMAIKETKNNVFVALTGGMPLVGVEDSVAAGGNIGWGDLFFNFSGKNFQAASASNNLLGIRFAGTNDSGAAATGVYTGVSAKSVSGSNHGYTSLDWYYDAGFERPNSQGTDLPNAQAVYDYFYPASVATDPNENNTPLLNVINTGTKVGDVVALTDLSSVDFAHFGADAVGTHTIGFKFDRSLFGSGNYIANLFLECGNDGIALEVPEPVGLVTFAALGLMGSGLLRRKQA